jgi:A/G-specific adenine glycosylase
MMDLGAAICLPGRPKCMLCPLAEACRARAAGIAQDLPARSPKPARPLRRGAVFWLVRRDGAVLLRRRPEQGLLGGMMEFPSTAWRAEAWDDSEAKAAAPLAAGWTALPGLVRHGFTHFELELQVFSGRLAGAAPADAGVWCPIDRLSEMALPTLMKKVARHALGQIGRSPGKEDSPQRHRDTEKKKAREGRDSADRAR